MVDPVLISLAKEKALEHHLDPALVCAICEKESSWKPKAYRYEPGFMSRYVVALYTAGKISATECYGRAMSWGLMQIMGLTAREQGFKGEFLAELTEPEAGLEQGCIKLTSCLTHRHGDVTEALLMYNGGSETTYPSSVLAIQARYALAVPAVTVISTT